MSSSPKTHFLRTNHSLPIEFIMFCYAVVVHTYTNVVLNWSLWCQRTLLIKKWLLGNPNVQSSWPWDFANSFPSILAMAQWEEYWNGRQCWLSRPSRRRSMLSSSITKEIEDKRATQKRITIVRSNFHSRQFFSIMMVKKCPVIGCHIISIYDLLSLFRIVNCFIVKDGGNQEVKLLETFHLLFLMLLIVIINGHSG